MFMYYYFLASHRFRSVAKGIKNNSKTKICLWDIKKVDLCVKIFKLFLYHIFVLAGGQIFYIWNGKEVEHLCLQCIKFSKEKVATKRWEKFGSKLGIVLYIFLPPCLCIVYKLSTFSQIKCRKFQFETADVNMFPSSVI